MGIDKDTKYLYGIYKNFKKKYPNLSFKDFRRELERNDFDAELFYRRIEEKQYGDFGKWI